MDSRLRAQRPPKPPIDPWRPIGVHRELERGPDGSLERCLTIFLAGRECPFTCIFCDLWRYTIDDATPVGAIPRQIRIALEEDPDPADTLKLYNASNLFDDKAVPPQDDDEILRLVRGARRIVVECHAKLIGDRCARWAEALGSVDSKLEVAVGFETVHPEALAKLNKKVEVSDLRRAGLKLGHISADLRAFVLIGVPFIAENEQLTWLRRSAEAALEAGARIVSLIPLRSGENEMIRLETEGSWRPPDLDLVEAAYEVTRPLAPERIRLDTWDLDELAQSAAEKARLDALRGLQLEPFSGAPA